MLRDNDQHSSRHNLWVANAQIQTRCAFGTDTGSLLLNSALSAEFL